MSFQIQITVDSIEEAERILACLRHDNPPAAQQVNAQVESGKNNSEVAPPKPRGRPRREKAEPLPADTESATPSASLPEKQDPAPAPGSEVEVEGRTAQQTPTFDDAKAALKALLAKHNGDMSVPLQVLGRFEAERISAVAEADYGEFIAACEAA